MADVIVNCTGYLIIRFNHCHFPGVTFSDDRQVDALIVSFEWQLNEGQKTDTVVTQSRHVESLMTSEFSSEGTYLLSTNFRQLVEYSVFLYLLEVL